MQLIDTHCHLYLPVFAADIQEVIKRGDHAGIKKYYLPAIDSTYTTDLLRLEQEYPEIFVAMMGLHPCSVKENYKTELAIIEEWFKKRSFAAIGEIGLDFFWDTAYTPQQYEVFEWQMQLALDKKIPVVIHTRNAMQQTIDCVKPFAANGLRGIVHCFGDSYETAVQIIDMGFYLGIGGVVTYKKSGLDEVIKKLDLKHIVLETDAPYLTPVPYRGKRNESSFLKIIAEKIAALKDISVEEVADATTANAEKIFSNAG